MNIVLDPKQEAWLHAKVAQGDFGSVEEAVRQIIEEHIWDDDDLSWAKPLFDEARAELDRREAVTHEEFQRLMAEKIETLRGS